MTLFTNYLTNLCTSLKKYSGHEVFAVGNFNICLSECTNDSRILLNCMNLYKLNQIIKENTRLGNTKLSTLDHIYTNSSNIVASGTGMLNVSNHLLINVTRKKPKSKCKTEYIYKRKILDEKIPDFKTDVYNHNWNEMYNLSNTTEMWTMVVNVINYYADKNFQSKNIKKEINL